MLHSAPYAPTRGVFLPYSLRCPGCSSPWHRVLLRTIQSGGLGRAPLRPGCSNPGRLFAVFSRLPRTLQSVAPGSPPDDPVRGLGPSSTPPRMLQSGASCFLLSLLSSAHQPHSARSGELALRTVGAAGGPRGGGASCLGVGRPGSGAHPRPTTRPFGRAAGARFPLAVGAVCGRGGPAVLCTLSRAAVRRVLCALPGLAAPGGRCGLVPVLVPWLWLATCLSGVPRGPALVRRSLSGAVALSAPVGFPVAVVPSPIPGAVAPGFTWWLRGARGGRPRTGLILPAAGPCRGKGAGRAPRHTRSGPRDGVVPGGSLRRWSWAACAAVVRRVWTRSLTRPVSRTVLLSTGDSAGAPGLFCVDADTAPFGSEDATPGSRACVCACLSWPGRAGRPPGRVLVRLIFPLAVLGALFACSAPSGQGLPRFRLLLAFFFSFLFPSPPLVAPPLCPALRVFRPRVPWASASCRPSPPFFSPPPLCAPRCLLLFVFSGFGCLGPRLLVAPPHSRPLVPPPPCCLWRFLLSGCLGPLRPPPFFFPSFFLPVVRCGAGLCFLRLSGVPACASVVLSLSLLCVRRLVLCGVGCWAWLSCAVSRWVLVSCFGGAVLVWPRGSPPCGLAWCVLVFPCPVLCSVALCCRVVVCCRALPLVCLCLLFVSCRRASAVCVLGCRAVCSLSSPPCAVLCCAVLVPFRFAVRVVCDVPVGWCCWFPVSLPFVGGLLVALVARRCRLVVCVGFGARVWSGCRSASSLWCPAPLCCVLWRCAAVWFCAVVPCLLFLFFSLPVALVSCCSPLVLRSELVPGRFCFSALPVRCCAGVPASLPSVRFSLASVGLAGVLGCCLLCLCVCCPAWLSSVVSWWVLVAPGVVSRWRAVVCPWVLCCAVLLRVVPPGVALLCAVLFRCAPFGAAARCVVSWGAVRSLRVLCLLAPCFVLSPRAVCVLLLFVAAWCCSPLCFVPCAPWGVVLCVSCCTYLKNRCKISKFFFSAFFGF